MNREDAPGPLPPPDVWGALRPRAREGGAQATLRLLNRGAVLDVIKREGPISRVAVARRTALTKPTVSAIVEELAADGMLSEIGIGVASPAGGRRPVLYSFNAASYCLLGVHVGVEAVAVALADGAGVELARTAEPTPRDPESALRLALRLGGDLAGDATGPLRSVGVVVPGLVDHRHGTCLLAPNLGWRDVNVSALVGADTDAAVAVHNVAQAVLAAEHLEGAVRAHQDVVLLYEDRGVGAAILAEGRLYHGARGIAGELGHSKTAAGTQRCGCGGVGCLETEVAAPAVLRRVRRLTRSRPRDLAAVARRDDPVLQGLLLDVGRELGRAAALLVNVLNPQAVVLAGGFLDAGPRLVDGVREAIASDALAESAAEVEILQSALGGDGPVRGAVLLARHAAERDADPLFGTITNESRAATG